MTGLLHDVGELVAASLPPPLAELARPDRHARLGAYLLSLWGFPDAVVEAIAHHHDPGAVPAERAVLVDLIHLAELAATELAPAGHEVSGPSHAWLARNKGDAIPRAVEQARHLDRALPRAS
jgi:HD-like signal output (HDOD) protein